MLLISALSISVIYLVGVLKTEHCYSSRLDDLYMICVLVISPFVYMATMYTQDFQSPFVRVDYIFLMYVFAVAGGFSATTIGMLWRWIRIKHARPYESIRGYISKPVIMTGIVEDTRIVEDSDFGRCLELVLDNRVVCRFTKPYIKDVDQGKEIKLSGFYNHKQDVLLYAKVILE